MTPSWLTTGTAPQWGVFVVVLLALIRLSLPWRKLSIDAATQLRAELQERVAELKADHKECIENLNQERKERADAVRACREACDDKILGMKRQQAQQQISFINAIINSIDAPELKTLLTSLESVQAAQRLDVIQFQDETVIRPEQADD